LSAAAPPPEVVAAADKLLDDSLDVYLAARRQLLVFGPGCKGLVEERIRKVSPHANRRVWMRLHTLLGELQALEANEQVVRVTEEALRRGTQIEKKRDPKAAAKVAVLTSRAVAGQMRVHPNQNPYAGMCYFSFPRDEHGYAGAVSLEFGNGGDTFQVLMYGGQKNRIKSLGAVDFAGIKSAPPAKVTATWEERGERNAVKVGDVYIEHCLEPRDRVDLTVKFRVLDLKPGKWVVIEWEAIPQDK
jgi:hypothetical protein